MDHRKPLKHHTHLTFEGMDCHIEDVVGQGSNAIVYKGWYPDRLNREQRHHVLIKELFPYHPNQKIHRDDRGCIFVEPDAQDLWSIHKASFEVGNTVHLRLLQSHPDLMVMGANLNSYEYNGTLYSVLGYTGGRSLQTELNCSGITLHSAAHKMIGLLDALEAFHKSNYLHLDISPDNIMLVGQKEQTRIFLIDYNSAREVGSCDSSYLSCKAGYSAPEVHTGNLYSIGFASDLYSVAAVFYRCIMGKTLLVDNTLQRKPPDGQDSSLLQGMPQTVCSMVESILKKGLQTLPRRRYQSIGQMRQAFQELIDRIDCVGVTHWSLWENGKRSVEELIRINPSLRYLKEESKLYPIRLMQEDSLSLQAYLDRLLSPEGKSALILAQGGMGKTTLLLHTAMLQSKTYTSASPAMFYISLNNWSGADTHYIRSQILLRLRFKKDENTFDSALHALHELMQQPLHTRQQDVPAIVLLLDGLNEVKGEITPLLQEINELNAMAGVRILAASRSEIPELNLKTAALMPLEAEDIESALGRNGLLIPHRHEILHLLRTPLILSIYMQTCESGMQPDITGEDELMKAYMDSLLEKEIRDLPEDSPLRWQIDAALHYVLPAIAAGAKKSGQSLTERRMLRIVEGCRHTLHSSLRKRVFPQWIGRSSDIFGDAQAADQWYGIIIHRILWQRMGLLTQDADGNYRIFHQVIGEYLAEQYRSTGRKIVLLRTASAAAAVLIVLAALFLIRQTALPYLLHGTEKQRVVSYDDDNAQDVISHVTSCYSAYGLRYSEMDHLNSLLLEHNSEDFVFWYDGYSENRYPETFLTDNREDYSAEIAALCTSGEQVSWSEMKFDGDSALLLIAEAEGQLQYYNELLPVMKAWAQAERAQRNCPNFPEKVAQLLTLDGKLMSKLYHQSCYPHLDAGEEPWKSSALKLAASIPQAGVNPEETAESLLYTRDKAMEELASLCTTIRLIDQSGYTE